MESVDCKPKKLAQNLSDVHGSEAMRLINVATTRAKGKLIVIADVQHILNELKNSPDNILFQWICHLEENAYVHSVKEE